ncbi:MAG: hypothetical protein ACM336_07980 [Acidobacteriota bacterium]
MIGRREFAFGMLAGVSGRIWPSEPLAGCPFPQSETLKGIRFTGARRRYANADTWYPSWASDGNLYSPWTDGKVGEVASMSIGKKATTGHATILGDSPLDLQVVNAAVYPGDPAPYGGRYPCGSLVYNGVWYYGTYCLMDSDGDPGKGLNWDILGPFVGFRHSEDFGKTWTDTPHTPARPLFHEPKKPGGPVKIGAPHFVDFGKNMRYSPDGKAYLVGHGAAADDPTPRAANLSWITGDQIYLMRVEPSIANMNDPAKYEFFAGHDRRGRAVWSQGLEDLKPVVEWDDHTGCVTVTYDAPLKKYLMCVTDGGTTVSRFHTYLLEADAITGPWKLVVLMKNFGEQAYFVNIPSKFIGADGRDLWLMYSANFTNGYLKTNYRADPPDSGYGMCVQQVRLY